MKPPKVVKIVFPTDGNMNMMPVVYDKIMIKAGHNVFKDAANYVRADIVDEMLTALEDALDYCHDLGQEAGDYPRDEIIAALAKAKGETE